ncbi:uncharacterized protein LOC130736556 [Lotus japonicus]|uniref:uncharacterized protein LOC130736556 n=1 Tax=Lotus japonicus TaxID=34305 RepID=UPI00258E71C5|nr:uncharacterized protein LOC130736556 [Lotus japonicus]
MDVRSLVMEEEVLEFCIEYAGQALFLYKLVEDIFGVRALTVCNYFLQVVPTGGCLLRMPRSLNVRSLTIKTSLEQDELLGITSMSYLSTLTLRGSGLIMQGLIHASYILREVEIKDFKGSNNEISMLTYFITTGRALRKITINISKDDVVDQDGRLDSYYRSMTEMLSLNIGWALPIAHGPCLGIAHQLKLGSFSNSRD